MTLREKIHERIDNIDDAQLPKLLKQLERFEKHGRFSDDFWEALHSARERNKDDDPDDILREVTEVVNTDRQSRRP